MNRVLYEVAATIIDPDVIDAWTGWMLDEHIRDVVRAGARCGGLIRIDDVDHGFIVQYEFESREALNRYFADHAPRLRDEGARRFGRNQVQYTRRTGEIIEPRTDSTGPRD